MTTMAATVPMPIRIDQSLNDRLTKIASLQNRSPHSLATQAVEKLVEEQEKLQAWNQSCVDSFNEYKTTGLHVTQDEVEKWMDSLGSYNELASPKCHR